MSNGHIVTERSRGMMTFLTKLLISFALLGSLSAAANDDSQILSFSKQELTSVINQVVHERMVEIESRLEHEISVLKSGLGKVEVENRHLKSKVDSMEKEIEMLKSGVPITSYDRPQNYTKEDKDFRRVAPYHPPAPESAFKARLTHTLTDVGPNQIIKFDVTEVNIGTPYNPTTGVFTCDIPGLYVFHLTLTLYANKYVELFIKKNGQISHYFYLANKDYLGSGSTSALIQLDHGDTVVVQSDGWHSTGDLIYPNYSSFFGFLLYPRVQN